MNHAVDFIWPALAGIGIGLFFYGGLWFTVARIAAGARPWVWVGASFIIRTAVALGGLWWIGQGNAARIIVCLGAFIVARPLVVRLTAP